MLYCIKEIILYLWRSSNINIIALTKIKCFGVPLNTFIFFGRQCGDLQSFCVGPGFDSMLPSINSCANLRKLRLTLYNLGQENETNNHYP